MSDGDYAPFLRPFSIKNTSVPAARAQNMRKIAVFDGFQARTAPKCGGEAGADPNPGTVDSFPCRALLWNKSYNHKVPIMSIRRIAVLLSILFAATAQAEWVKLEKVTLRADPSNDGDSFHVVANGKPCYFRLYFVDTPETQARLKERIVEQAQVFGIAQKNVMKMGKAAEDFTRNRLKMPFTVWTEWEDAQGDSQVPRFFAFVRDSEGRDLGQELVGNGLARVYGAQADHPEGPTRMAQWGLLDQRLQAAKTQKLGCWNDKLK
jgi:endonuclease YncB( thermonuclease family)